MSKRIRLSFALIFVAPAFGGCVQTVYEKTVTVNKNANGTVQGIVVVEKVTQNRSDPPLPFTWLDEKRPGPDSP